MPDVSVYNGGSVVLVTPETESAREWVRENVAQPMYFGRAIAVEPRYVENLLHGMSEAGLTVGGV